MTQKDKLSPEKIEKGVSQKYEKEFWQAADELRGQMDISEYKHIVLRLIFLKYIFDVFQDRYTLLQDIQHADPENHNEYTSGKVFWIPEQARWAHLKEQANNPEIGFLIDNALAIIERENSSLSGIHSKSHSYSTLGAHHISKLIRLISNIGQKDEGSSSKDILAQVYEYFLERFAKAEGMRGSEFYTPPSIVKLLVEMLEPYKGSIYDPCCGSGGMFIQSEKFVKAHGGQVSNISIFGQEANTLTWQLCKMNLAIQDIEGDLGHYPEDTLRNDLHKALKADFILANPPFNVSNWGGEHLRQDVRWKYGIPPISNANFAWVQHFIYHLAPNGIAGFVLSNSSMGSKVSGEREIRKSIIEKDFVDCMVALPSQLFYATQIPACLWFLTPNKMNDKFRRRQDQTLFIDARNQGHLVDRTHRELSDDEIVRISQTYHAWRGELDSVKYEDIPGFCKSVRKNEIALHDYVLTPSQ